MHEAVKKAQLTSYAMANGMSNTATRRSDTARDTISRFDGVRSLRTRATAAQTRMLPTIVPMTISPHTVAMTAACHSVYGLPLPGDVELPSSSVSFGPEVEKPCKSSADNAAGGNAEKFGCSCWSDVESAEKSTTWVVSSKPPAKPHLVVTRKMIEHAIHVDDDFVGILNTRQAPSLHRLTRNYVTEIHNYTLAK